MARISITINGKVRGAQVEPRTLLVHFLREHLNLTGSKKGCDQGTCGWTGSFTLSPSAPLSGGTGAGP